MIAESLVPYLEGGISVLLAAASATGEPVSARAAGVRVSADRTTLAVLVPAATGRDLLRALAPTRRAALLFSRALDGRSVELHGEVRSLRASTPAEQAHASSTEKERSAMLSQVGLPRGSTAAVLTDSQIVELVL